MNKRQIAAVWKWIRGLRSGHYDQTTGQLLKIDPTDTKAHSFCCLGVLAVEKGIRYNAKKVSHMIFPSIGESMGHACTSEPPNDWFEKTTGLPSTFKHLLVTLNDSKGASFRDIAKVIVDKANEVHGKKVFK